MAVETKEIKESDLDKLAAITVEATEINDVVDNLKTLTSSASQIDAVVAGGAGLTPSQTEALDKIDGLVSTAGQIDATKTVNLNTVVIDGDSIAAMNGYFEQENGSVATDSGGFVAWANILLENRMNIIANNGVGGQRTDQLLTRLQASINLKPKFMTINIGTNDIGQLVPVATIKANLLEIINRVTDAGIVCVMNTILPRHDSISANLISPILQINSYLMSLQGVKANFVLVDTYSALVNPTTGLPMINTLTDGVHPSAYGASLMGIELANAIEKYMPNINYWLGGYAPNEISHLQNAYLLGGTTIAPYWGGGADSGVGVFSKVARTNGLEWQEVNMTQNGRFTLYNYIIEWEIGKKYIAMVEYELDDLAIPDNYKLSLEAKAAGNIGISAAQSIFIDDNRPIRFGTDVKKGVIATPEFEVPQNTADFIIFLTAKLTGKIRFGRIRIIEV